MSTEIATLGGGCFWCTEAYFEQLLGVEKVVSGYAGGHVVNPTYEQVCNQNTGHAEVIQVTFDPTVLTYETLLSVFFVSHDPTTPNRQGNDVGPQYRSVIFYHDDSQHQTALRVIKTLSDSHVFAAPIVTEVSPFTNFYPAEDYHQGYFRSNPYQPYCAFVISPKLAKIRKLFAARFKS